MRVPEPDAAASPRADYLDELRAAQSAREEYFDAHRREVLLCGPDLADISAAASCRCSCHPRPADVSRHGGGPECPCQWSEEERRARRLEALESLRSLAGSLELFSPAEVGLVHARAASLGASVSHCGGLAPFVLRGMVDGRAFYLRERHEEYQVVMAPDEAPESDPWEAPARGIAVHAGTMGDLLDSGAFSLVRALEVAVSSVRRFLLRRDCAHRNASAGLFCPDCGASSSPGIPWVP